jgi:AraC family transcriptional regulator
MKQRETSRVNNSPIAQQTTSAMPGKPLAVPRLYLSSHEAGWEGLGASAFYEPAEIEDWAVPGIPDTTLMLLTGGAMHMEWRRGHGPWKGGIVHAQDLILTPGSNASSEVRWKGLSCSPMQTLRLQLNHELLSRTAQEVADVDPARLTLVAHTGLHDSLLTQIGLALWRELEQQAPSGKLYAQTAAQMIAVHLLRHYSSTEISVQERSQGLTRRQVQSVTDFILAHLSQDISLEALAQQIGFSPYHFARLFRQTTGESPHQFVLRQRVEKARHLLKTTDMPLAHIAIESGFANQSHFTRIFKRDLGLTPRAYRQQGEIHARSYHDSQE